MGQIIKISTAGMTMEEWRASRKNSIGGSDAATVLGLNPWSSPYTLWAEKTGTLEPEDISKKEAVRLGHYLEPYVAERFTEETGKRVRRENYILKNKYFPWAHANVDRLVIGEKAGLECKTTSELMMGKFKDGEYPANYYCQCMHYMAVTGFEKWYLAVLIGNRDFRIFEIRRNEDEIAALMEAEQRFWGYVKQNVPPPVDGTQSTAETLEALYPETGGSVDLTPVCGSIRQYLALKKEIKKLEDHLELCANTIKEHMRGASRGSFMDIKVSWSETTTSRFDKKAFEKENPGVDLSIYSKVSKSRRFAIKE